MFLLLGLPILSLHLWKVVLIAASTLTLLQWGAKGYALDSLEVNKSKHILRHAKARAI